MKKLNLAINGKSLLLDQYDIKEKIGKGKFGLVKYGIHKDTSCNKNNGEKKIWKNKI